MAHLTSRANPGVVTTAERLASLVFVCLMFCLGQSATAQSNYTLRSPDQRIEVRVRAADRLSYDVLLNVNSKPRSTRLKSGV